MKCQISQFTCASATRFTNAILVAPNSQLLTRPEVSETNQCMLGRDSGQEDATYNVERVDFAGYLLIAYIEWDLGMEALPR